MKMDLREKSVHARLVFDTNKDFSWILARSMKNMTGDLANEGCYDPRLHGNSEPLYVYRVDFRTWLLSDAALNDSERQEVVRLIGQRPRHMEGLLAEDIEKFDAEQQEPTNSKPGAIIATQTEGLQ